MVPCLHEDTRTDLVYLILNMLHRYSHIIDFDPHISSVNMLYSTLLYSVTMDYNESLINNSRMMVNG